MPTVAELKAAWDDARAATTAAEGREREAKAAYLDAAFQATGLAGHAVEYTRRTWKKSTTYKIVPTRFASWSERYVAGPVVKKDGTLGTKEMDLPIDGLTDLGPFQP